MSTFISAKIAHFSAYFASSGPAETPLHQMTPQQKIALATQIRAGHADAIFKVTHGPVSIEEQAERRHFFANADVQRKLVKGWIHGTMTEPAIIDAMKETGVVLTKDACEKIWYAKSALMLDTFKNRPETLSVLPLLKNLSIEQRREIANSCLEHYRDPGSLMGGVQTWEYYNNLWKNDNFQKLATDLIAELGADDDLRAELIVCVNTRKSSEMKASTKASTNVTTTVTTTDVSTIEVKTDPKVSVEAEAPIIAVKKTASPHVQSLIGLTKLSMVALQLFAYASNQDRLVGAMGGLMIPHTFPSSVGMFHFQDFQYGPGVTPFNVNDVKNVNNLKNTESDFQYISFDDLEIENDEFDASVDADVDAPKLAIDVLEYQYASYTASLNFAASNASKPVFYTSLGDYGWSTAVTDVIDAADYDDMPALVPLNSNEIEK